MSIDQLLDSEPIVATAGVEILEQALVDQAATTAAADWRPPAPGTEDALATLAASGITAEANATAIARMLSVRPLLMEERR